MSLTDDIYHELLDGLEKGLDWQQFIVKHSNSKGPLYNAIGRLFTEVGAKVVALNEERCLVQTELDQAGLTMDSLDQKIKEAGSNIASLKEKENVLKEQVATQETRLTEKSELATHLAEVEKLGFHTERLSQLKEALKEIGVRHGFKGKEAVSKFFDDLKDYESVLGTELQLKGLETKIETKKLEAENWQAKEEALKRKHDDLKEAVEAVHTLLDKGIKTKQIVTWHKILTRFQTVEQLDQGLVQYGDITELINARKKEATNCELRLAKAQSQVESLEKERARIEAAIDALRVAGVRELKEMTEEATKQLKVVAACEIRETQAVGQEFRSEFSHFFTQIDALAKKAFQIGEEIDRTRQELKKYEGLREVLESHTDAEE